MKWIKTVGYFCLGGSAYVALELLWRGWSHVSLFVAGGVAFLLLGQLRLVAGKWPLLWRGLAGAGVITAVELAVGLVVNREYGVWDYRGMPLNFMGQICAPFCLLWIPISLVAMGIHGKLDSAK